MLLLNEHCATSELTALYLCIYNVYMSFSIFNCFKYIYNVFNNCKSFLIPCFIVVIIFYDYFTYFYVKKCCEDKENLGKEVCWSSICLVYDGHSK